MTVASTAGAATYRCEVNGRVVYADQPCPAGGRQSELDIRDQQPTRGDRQAAEERLRRDRAEAARLQAERQARERVDASDTKRAAAREQQRKACARLEVRAKRARDDAAEAGPRQAAAKRMRSRRADEDYAAACKR